MRPVGKSILIRKIESTEEKKPSLILTTPKRSIERYQVISTGMECKEAKSGDIIRAYSESAYDHELDIDGKVYIINEAHILVIE